MSTTSTEPPAVRSAGPGRHPAAVAAAAFGVIVVLVGAAALVGQALTVTERSTRIFSGLREVRVDAGSGDVEVTGGARTDVRVDTAAQRSWSRPRLEQRVEGGVLWLTARCRIVFGSCGAS